jgi:hypothetical protein
MVITKLVSIFFLCISFSYLVSTGYTRTREENDKEQRKIYERIQLKKKKGISLGYKDFEHVNPGCPENTICSKLMGEKLTSFKKLISKLRDSKIKDKIKSLNKFLKTKGLPIKFLSLKKSFEHFAPIMWNSSCSNHGATKTDKVVVFASQAFSTGTKGSKVNFKLGNKIHSIEHGELATLDRVDILGSNKSYYLPHLDRPLFFNGDELVVIKNSDDFYYGLAVSSNGSWRVIDHIQGVKKFYRDRQEIKCPKDLKYTKKFFQGRFCQKVYDLKSKKYKVVSLPWSCL